MSTLGGVLSILTGKAIPVGTTTMPASQRASKQVSYGGGPYGGPARPTTVLTHGTEDYTASATAYRAVHFIASNLAAVDLTVQNAAGEAARAR